VCAVLSSVCATTVDNSGVYVYYLKGIVSVYFRRPARLGLWVSPDHAFTCVSTSNQAELRPSAIHLLAMWEPERTTAIVHKEAVHLLSLQPASITS